MYIALAFIGMECAALGYFAGRIHEMKSGTYTKAYFDLKKICERALEVNAKLIEKKVHSVVSPYFQIRKEQHD